MDSKYIILIVAVLVIGSAYMMFTPKTHYETLQIAGSTSVQPVVEKLAQAYMKEHPNVRINVQGGGSGLGIRTTEQGIVQIGMSSEELKSDEKTQLNSYTLGEDGIVVAVNNANNVTSLTKEQVRDIFSGKITNWKQVGGQDVQVHVIVREAGSGTMDAFKNLVMGTTKVREDAIVQSSTEAVKQAVKQDPGAIGFVSMAHMSSDVKALKIGGVSPSDETVSNGSYELQRPFLLLFKGQPTGVAKEFLEWVKGPEAQAIIKEEKVVPVSNSTG